MSFSPERTANMEFSCVLNVASEFYSPLPYHNFEHALDTLIEAQALSDYCESHDLVVNRRVVDYAALLHDAGYDHPINTQKFASKEAYAAQIAAEVLNRESTLSKREILEVQNAILGTKLNESPQSLEAKILRRADLANIAGDYDRFVICSLSLLNEAQILNTAPPDFETWIKNVDNVLRTYLKDDVSFGQFDQNDQGDCYFTAAADANLLRLGAETPIGLVAVAQRCRLQLLKIF